MPSAAGSAETWIILGCCPMQSYLSCTNAPIKPIIAETLLHSMVDIISKASAQWQVPELHIISQYRGIRSFTTIRAFLNFWERPRLFHDNNMHLKYINFDDSELERKHGKYSQISSLLHYMPVVRLRPWVPQPDTHGSAALQSATVANEYMAQCCPPSACGKRETLFIQDRAQ